MLLTPTALVYAAFGNYNSILIGDRAAGMGGAFTALTDDPGGCSFYNPAALSVMSGRSLSAAINVYHKYDIDFGNDAGFSDAPFRVNRGAFKSIPAASGNLLALGPFAFGLSILVPDHGFFAGEVYSDDENSSNINIIDESLWVGGTLALNLTSSDSVGLTMYYTSRNLVRSVTDRRINSSSADLFVEDKTFHNNSIIYILGYFRQLSDRWTFGTSLRFPSLEVSGSGSYSSTTVNTSPYQKEVITLSNIDSETRVPSRAAVGIAYEIPKKYTLSWDLTYYGSERYADFDHSAAADEIVHIPILNAAFGFEYYLKEWLRLRSGIYSNFSSHPEIDPSRQVHQGDHIDMWGFSANLAIFTSDAVSLTLGGYYTGGRGTSMQRVAQQLRSLDKSYQTFAMLIASSYYF